MSAFDPGRWFIDTFCKVNRKVDTKLMACGLKPGMLRSPKSIWIWTLRMSGIHPKPHERTRGRGEHLYPSIHFIVRMF